MAQITASMVKELRDRTGVGMGKCKQALEVANGDIELAISNLRKEGMASAVKKEGRETKEGIIASAEHGNVIAVLEVNAETDFVARNERFVAFVQELAKLAAEKNPASLEEFLEVTNDKGISVEQSRVETVQSLGENIQIKRIACFTPKANSSQAIYIHMGGKIAALVEVEGSEAAKEVAREVALHVAAEEPKYVTAEEVPEADKEHEKEIARAQVKGKPEHIIDKILEGKLGAYYDQVCLLRQPFVKDSSLKVEEFVSQAGKEMGASLKVVRFERWVMGE